MHTFRKTSENWCENFGKNKDLAKVSIINVNFGFDSEFGCAYRVIVEGNDDTLMNFDIEYTNEIEETEARKNVIQKYIEVIKLKDITFDNLLNIGFEWF